MAVDDFFGGDLSPESQGLATRSLEIFALTQNVSRPVLLPVHESLIVTSLPTSMMVHRAVQASREEPGEQS